MERRAFLGWLSGGTAGGLLAGTRRRTWAQATLTPGGAPVRGTAPAPEAPMASAPGVTPKDVTIGMSAAFKGTAAGLGIEFYRGAQAYYSDVNAKGGVHGRAINVVALDDGYNPDPCIRNTVEL